MTASSAGAREIIDRLALAPHPEGGWYQQRTYLRGR